MKIPAIDRVAAIGFVLAISAAGTPVRAQTAPDDAAKPDEPPVKLEKFEVTGSYIPFASTQTALPLATLDDQAIADTSVATNILEVLRKAAPQFSGNGNLGNSNANADNNSTGGGSMLALRNTQTLVLVNGRRMTYAPILASGGRQFVDVNLIPLAAIDRIEVLKDGASATYGTDAVAGVVNIILKTNFQGVEAGARYSMATSQGHYTERSFSLVAGASRGATAVTVSTELTRSAPLFQYERGFSNPAYGTPSFAGVINTRASNALPQYYVLNPSLNAPPAGHAALAMLVAQGVYVPVGQFNLINGAGNERQYAFNLASAVTLLLENKRRSATLNFDHRVSDRLTVFGDVIYTKTNTFSQLNAQPLFATLPPTNLSNPTTQTMQVRNRFVSRPRKFSYDSDSLRGIVGARGKFARDFRWEAAVDKNVIDQNYTTLNVLDATLRAAAVTNGLINLAAREQAPGAVETAGIFGTAWGKAKSTLTTSDARVSGELAALPGGPLDFALGSEYRTETLKQTADKNSQTATFNWEGAVAIDPFGHDRNVWSCFAEVRAPLLGEKQAVPFVSALELSAAVRHERYSDTDDPTVPKFSLAWRPVREEWLIRATYSQSFAAPTLYNLFGPVSLNDQATLAFNQLGGGRVARDGHTRSGSNPALLPARAKNRTFGFVWSPKALKGFSFTADCFDIKQTALIAALDVDAVVQDVELHGAASPYAHFVKLGGFNGTAITAPGQLSAELTGNIYLDGRLVNIAGQKLRGADFTVDYAHSLAALGRLAAAVSMTAYQSYRYQSLPSTAPVETVGRASTFNGTMPRWQSSTALSWSRHRWRATLNWQHIPGVLDPEGDGTERKPFAIRAYDAFDVSAACTFDAHGKWLERLTLRTGANNVFNAMPPFGGGTFSGANADIATYSPIGRLLFVEGKYKF